MTDSVVTLITLERALVLDLLAVLKALEAAEPASVRVMACNVSVRFLPRRAYLLRETIRIRQQLEDSIADAAP